MILPSTFSLQEQKSPEPARASGYTDENDDNENDYDDNAMKKMIMVTKHTYTSGSGNTTACKHL